MTRADCRGSLIAWSPAPESHFSFLTRPRSAIRATWSDSRLFSQPSARPSSKSAQAPVGVIGEGNQHDVVRVGQA